MEARQARHVNDGERVRPGSLALLSREAGRALFGLFFPSACSRKDVSQRALSLEAELLLEISDFSLLLQSKLVGCPTGRLASVDTVTRARQPEAAFFLSESLCARSEQAPSQALTSFLASLLHGSGQGPCVTCGGVFFQR